MCTSWRSVSSSVLLPLPVRVLRPGWRRAEHCPFNLNVVPKCLCQLYHLVDLDAEATDSDDSDVLFKFLKRHCRPLLLADMEAASDPHWRLQVNPHLSGRLSSSSRQPNSCDGLMLNGFRGTLCWGNCSKIAADGAGPAMRLELLVRW